jgi:hypothetical protein
LNAGDSEVASAHVLAHLGAWVRGQAHQNPARSPFYAADVPSLAIIINDGGRFARMNYFIAVLAEAWRQMGIDTRLMNVPGPQVDADAAFLHINMTKIPNESLDRARRFSVVVNARATDISKRVVSRRLVQPGDGYAGAVMIKTDNNCGGLPERAGRYDPPIVGAVRRAWDRFAPWQATGFFGYGNYPILASPTEVPRSVWSDPRLVVEQFTPERHGDAFAVRSWTFLGEREINRLTLGPVPVVKRGNGTRTTDAGEVPEEVRAARERLGLDYGKIDYVVVDGVPIVLDANLTPTFGAASASTIRPLADRLAAGIERWLP